MRKLVSDISTVTVTKELAVSGSVREALKIAVGRTKLRLKMTATSQDLSLKFALARSRTKVPPPDVEYFQTFGALGCQKIQFPSLGCQ